MAFSLTNFQQILHRLSVKGVWSFCSNGSALLNKMASMMQYLKNLLIQNQESYEAQSLYIALGMQDVPNLFK